MCVGIRMVRRRAHGRSLRHVAKIWRTDMCADTCADMREDACAGMSIHADMSMCSSLHTACVCVSGGWADGACVLKLASAFQMIVMS